MLLIDQVRRGLGIGHWIYQHEGHSQVNKSVFGEVLENINRSL